MATGPSVGRIPVSPATTSKRPELVSEAEPAAVHTPRSWLKYTFFGVQIVAALIVFIHEAPRLAGDPFLFAFLISLNIAAQFVQIGVYGTSRISVGFVFSLTIIMLFGTPGVVIAAPLTALASRLGARKVDFRIVLNSARFVLIYCVGATVYDAFGNLAPTHPGVGMVAGGIAATIVCFSLSAGMIMASIAIMSGRSLSALWEEHRWFAPHYAAMGVVAISLAAAYEALGIFGMIAFFIPVLMMRVAMKQYVDKTAENVGKLKEQNVELQRANIQVVQARDDLKTSYDETLIAVVNALEARDHETKGHSIRVSHYMMDIAAAMGVKEGTQEWTNMQRGSLLHDVGKIGVSDSILLKPGKLTNEEWMKMREHPVIGYNMLREVSFLQGAADLILEHHERWDGEGYPKGLKGEKISLGARIFMVVDTFDSMTSDRVYRRGMTTLEALNEILRCSGTQFDPQVVKAFLEIYETWVIERDELHRMTDLAA